MKKDEKSELVEKKEPTKQTNKQTNKQTTT
jgi:hypothetical protein